MFLAKFSKAFLPTRWLVPTDPNSRNLKKSAVSHAVFYIKDINEYVQKVKLSRLPIFVNLFTPTKQESITQVECIQEIIKTKPSFIIVAQVDITLESMMNHIDDKDLQKVPLLAIVRDGKIVQRWTGPQSKEGMSKWMDKAFAEVLQGVTEDETKK